MGISEWIGANWFVLLQTIGIIASLLFTGFSMRAETRSRRLNNVIRLSDNHRSIWSLVFDRPHLRRHFANGVNAERRLLVIMLILHLHTTYRAVQAQELVAPTQLAEDIRQFFSDEFSLGIWKDVSRLQEPDFVEFVDSTLATGTNSKLRSRKAKTPWEKFQGARD